MLRAIQWNAAEREDSLTAQKAGVEIAYTVEENEFRGERYVELRLEDFSAQIRFQAAGRR